MPEGTSGSEEKRSAAAFASILNEPANPRRITGHTAAFRPGTLQCANPNPVRSCLCGRFRFRGLIQLIRNLVLPGRQPAEANENWKDAQSVVITGANGSGKTRLGVWIEENNPDRAVHRIAAQRALNFPDLIAPVPYDQARSQLYYGAYNSNWNEQIYRNSKRQSRWGGNPAIQLLTDYHPLLITLFAEEARRNREYTVAARSEIPNAKAPDCNLDVLLRIWSTVFPHRGLLVRQDKITARLPSSSEEYSANIMSDGERVAIYLLGQVLCAPQNAIVVIDEPEIHLHRSIQAKLWDEAEAERQDCTFVYITHDLDFASTRSGARKIWTKNFDGLHWEWKEVKPLDDLPEPLLLQVIGNRRPVLFHRR